MSDLHPALATALGNDAVRIFGAVQIEFATGTKRLLDGSAEITIGGQIFRGEEADFGTLESIDELEDGTGDEAPGMALTILPASDAAVTAMTDPDLQGTVVRLMFGAVSETTGAVIGDPYLVFLGEIDRAVHKVDRGKVRVEFECVGGMERLFFNDEGIRLSSSFHKQVWPGELGMNFATGVSESVYWGSNDPIRA